MTLLGRTIAAAALAVPFLLVPGTGHAADAAWTIGTADDALGAGRENYRYTLTPGDSLGDGLVISNPGATPLRLAVYAADGFTNRGQLDLLGKTGTSTKLGTWVHPGSPDVTVAPGQTTKVPFTLTVPANAAPGDYMGGIVTSLDGSSPEERRGIRIRVRVSGPLHPTFAVESLRVRYPGLLSPLGKARATVTYTVRNIGNTILAARQSVSVSGLFGTSKANAVADTPELLPGDTWKVTVPVNAVPTAPHLTATVKLTPLLTDAAGSTAPLTAATSETHRWAPLPWAPLAALLATVIAGTAALVVRRRRSGTAVPKSPEQEPIAADR